jgi:hypothetical protein
MRVIALETETPDATAEAFRALAREEAIGLWALVQAGVVRETYFRTDRADAVLQSRGCYRRLGPDRRRRDPAFSDRSSLRGRFVRPGR